MAGRIFAFSSAATRLAVMVTPTVKMLVERARSLWIGVVMRRQFAHQATCLLTSDVTTDAAKLAVTEEYRGTERTLVVLVFSEATSTDHAQSNVQMNTKIDDHIRDANDHRASKAAGGYHKRLCY